MHTGLKTIHIGRISYVLTKMQGNGGTIYWGEFPVYAGIGRPFSPNPSANLVGREGSNGCYV